jgi:lipoprotein
MMKKQRIFGLLLCASLLASCSLFWSENTVRAPEDNCPSVIIPRDVAYVTQKVNYKDDFRIEITGFSGYCYFDKRVNRRKAVITPQFEVRRLRQKLDETDVDFEYFTETVKGPPEYLGKKHYFGHVTIPLNRREMAFSGKTLELKIPNRDYGRFEIFLGLELTPEERNYNNRTFDVKYRFEENH